jgi:hypothetical protein
VSGRPPARTTIKCDCHREEEGERRVGLAFWYVASGALVIEQRVHGAKHRVVLDLTKLASHGISMA